jgi:membrane fusion protein, multidrug efflux system
MKTSKKIGFLVLIVVATACVGYKLYDVQQQKSDEISMVKKSKLDVPVTTATVKLEILKLDFSYNGTFDPNCEVTVTSESQGKVIEYTANEGDYISEGRTIARLDNDLIGYQLEIAQATYLKTQDDLRRFENLSAGEAVSEQQLAEIKLAFTNAKNTYQSLKKQHENTIIKAPISGNISKHYIEKGSFIAAGSPVIDMIDIRKMKFNAKFTATDLTRIKIGQKVRLTTDLYPDASYTGIIKVIGVKPDNSKRYLVQIEVENNKSKPLFAGIDGAVHFESQEQECLVIPRNCIIGSIIEPKVYVVSNNIVNLRPVIIKSVVNNQAIIESGLAEGERVVLSGQINLEESSKVVVQNN